MTHRTSFPLAVALASSLLLASVAAHAQSRCEAPRVLFVVDKSSTMLGLTPEGITKWEAARQAIAELASAFEDRIDFGLMPFPLVRNACTPGEVVLDIAPRTADEILTALGDPPPARGHWTPMAETLRAAAEYAPLRQDDRSRHVVLITDGWQWCSPYDPTTRFEPVTATEALADLGVTIHVIGFGGSVDALTLNRAAVAGGTAKPGCDPDSADASDPNNCYDQVGDLAGLRAALDAIGRSVTDEVCDGYDNDCDGEVDEGYDQDGDGYTTCGTVPGEPGVTDMGRVDCVDDDPAIHPGAEEVCDAVDNDCDGEIDPGCDCTDGEERPCGTDTGACAMGTQRCEAGRWGFCTGAVTPAERDVCDGRDEDCDGEVDEDGGCPEGYACHDGNCIDLTPPEPPAEPPSDDEPAEQPPEPEQPVVIEEPPMDGGCACRLEGRGTDPAGALPGLLLLGWLVRRRRHH